MFIVQFARFFSATEGLGSIPGPVESGKMLSTVGHYNVEVDGLHPIPYTLWRKTKSIIITV